MTESIKYYRLFPAGYLITEDWQDLRRSNEYYRNFGPYYGVDRRPQLIAPDDTLRRLLGVPAVTDMRLRAALEEWFDCHPPATAFITDEAHAVRLCETLRSFGYRLELLYCQLALKNDEEDRLAAYKKVEGPVPVFQTTFGFDVSWPLCNHSAILQPGVVPSSASWRSRLNQYGLLDNYADALELRKEYLTVQPELPFDIYFVHRVR